MVIPYRPVRAAILLAISLLCGCDGSAAKSPSEAHANGAVAANADLDNGILKLKEYPPLPAPAYHGEYVKLLRERCGCDYEVVNSAGISKEIQEEVNGYNETMTAELQRRFGATILEDLHAEAMKRWEARAKSNRPVDIQTP